MIPKFQRDTQKFSRKIVDGASQALRSRRSTVVAPPQALFFECSCAPAFNFDDSRLLHADRFLNIQSAYQISLFTLLLYQTEHFIFTRTLTRQPPAREKSPPQEPPEGPPGGLSKKYHFTLFYVSLIILLYIFLKLAMLFQMMKKIFISGMQNAFRLQPSDQARRPVTYQ